MNPLCKKCLSLGIAALAGIHFFHCPNDERRENCPSLPPEYHLEVDIMVPLELRIIASAYATVASPVTHSSIIARWADPDRDGNDIVIFKF